jgi:hypothetical protein
MYWVVWVPAQFLAALFYPPRPSERAAGSITVVGCVKSKSTLLPLLCVSGRFDTSASLGLPDVKCR